MIRCLVLLVFLCIAEGSWGQQYVISTLSGGIPPTTPSDAASASIGDPLERVTVDASGNLYFASVHSVFKVDRQGTLTRIAGTGRSGVSGDGGPAINAQLAFPDGIAVDPAAAIFTPVPTVPLMSSERSRPAVTSAPSPELGRVASQEMADRRPTPS